MSPSSILCLAMPVVFKTRNPVEDDWKFGSAVPPARHPQPHATEVLRRCGPNAALVEAHYKGQQSPWGFISYNAHSVAFVVTATNTEGVLCVNMVEQWRVTDAASLEVPAGGASSLQEALRGELEPEVGIPIEAIDSVTVFRPLAAEVCRAVHEQGGPKSVHVVHVRLRDGVPLNVHQYSDGQDEHVKGFWVSVSDLKELVKTERVVDIVTLTALMRCLDL
jgi:8-oxo-dGTP pyrophosphatase MutT (NUDIX family)